jgi:hypothetical protein
MSAVNFGITLKKEVFDKLENVRGRISRSGYISMLVEGVENK